MVRQTLPLLLADHPVNQIVLVADQHDHDVGVGLLLDILEPALNVVEGGLSRNIVDDYGSAGSSVVTMWCIMYAIVIERYCSWPAALVKGYRYPRFGP